MTATYHHGNLREALVEAALEAVREQGPEGLAVRELARRVGVSHNAAYRHFADRDRLVAAVAERGLAGLVAASRRRVGLVPRVEPVLDARRRLAALGRGYVDFALAEPGLFRVVFASYPDVPPPDASSASAEAPGTGAPEPADDPYVMLSGALDDLVEVGFLAPAARPGAEVMCWAAVHGFAALTVEGPLRVLDPVERDAALHQVLATIDRGYGTTTRPAEPGWPPFV